MRSSIGQSGATSHGVKGATGSDGQEVPGQRTAYQDRQASCYAVPLEKGDRGAVNVAEITVERLQ